MKLGHEIWLMFINSNQDAKSMVLRYFKGNLRDILVTRTLWFLPPSIGGSCKCSHHPILAFDKGAAGAPAMLVQLIRTSSEPQQDIEWDGLQWKIFLNWMIWGVPPFLKNLLLSKLPKELLWEEFKSPVQNKPLTAASPRHSPVYWNAPFARHPTIEQVISS